MNELGPDNTDLSAKQDEADLNRLATLYKVAKWLCGLASVCFVPHTVIGLSGGAFFSQTTTNFAGGVVDTFPYALFAFVGVFYITCCLAVAFGSHMVETAFRTRRWSKWIYPVAIIHLLNAPLGLALGVYTLIIVSRLSIQRRMHKPVA